MTTARAELRNEYTRGEGRGVVKPSAAARIVGECARSTPPASAESPDPAYLAAPAASRIKPAASHPFACLLFRFTHLGAGIRPYSLRWFPTRAAAAEYGRGHGLPFVVFHRQSVRAWQATEPAASATP